MLELLRAAALPRAAPAPNPAWRERFDADRLPVAEALSDHLCEDRLELALWASDLALWDWDVASGRLVVNDRWFALLGAHAGAPQPDYDAWTSLIHPDDAPGVMRTLDEHVRGASPGFSLEHRVRGASGGWIWVRWTGRAAGRDADGRAVRIVGSMTDITERKQSEDKFRVLFECSSLPHLLFGDDAVIDCNNAALEALRCHDKNDFIGMSAADLSPPRQPDGRLSAEKATEVISEGRARGFNRFEWTIRRVDGTTFPIEATMTRVNIAGDDVLLIVWHDLTERKEAEENQRRLMERLGERVKEMRTLNRVLAILQHEERLGVDDALERIVAELPAGFSRPAVTAARIAYAGGLYATPNDAPGRSVISETFCTSDGREGVVEVVWLDDAADDDPFLAEERELLGTIADAIRVNLDRRLAAEHLREAKEAAEAANAAKSEFLANMSHEIRTPMTAILGYAELLSSQDQPRDERASCVEVIRRNGAHLLTIINDILDISRIESGRVRVEPVACEPAAIVRECVSLLGERARDKGLRMQARFTTPVPRSIHTDPTRLRQILLSIVGNAIKFTQTGDVAIEVSCAAGGGERAELSVDVVDTGVGIADGQRDKLFRAFSQADTSSTRNYGGTGLGLVISKRLAELLGGDVRIIHSAPGRGSRFRLTLPAGDAELVDVNTQDLSAEPTPAARDTHERAAAPGRLTARVLLVEDGPDNQRLISFHLRRAGAKVEVAGNGREGVDAALAARDMGKPFDLVIMDMQMPVLDGYGATRTLRAAGCDTPIVALTAHAMDGDREKCLAAGCDAYAAKPIDAEALIAVCASALLQLDGRVV